MLGVLGVLDRLASLERLDGDRDGDRKCGWSWRRMLVVERITLVEQLLALWRMMGGVLRRRDVSGSSIEMCRKRKRHLLRRLLMLVLVWKLMLML